MTKGRLEAFSDAVIAIIITIMVLELRPPHGTDIQGLLELRPVFLSYLLSFIYLAIYWNNHHHLLHASKRVSGAILWANMHLLFWLSLVPFTTAWLGEKGMATLPVAIYGVVLLMAGIAYYILAHTIIRVHGHDSEIARSLGDDWKGKLSVLAYAVSITLAFIQPWIACLIYFLVAMCWFVPDKRIERSS